VFTGFGHRTIELILDMVFGKTDPKKVSLSGHDSCDQTLERRQRALTAVTEILQAGPTYRL
jgi:hypothetical protein